MYGCRVIQKALEFIPSDQQVIVSLWKAACSRCCGEVTQGVWIGSNLFVSFAEWDGSGAWRTRVEVCEGSKWQSCGAEVHWVCPASCSSVYHWCLQRTGVSLLNRVKAVCLNSRAWSVCTMGTFIIYWWRAWFLKCSALLRSTVQQMKKKNTNTACLMKKNC